MKKTKLLMSLALGLATAISTLAQSRYPTWPRNLVALSILSNHGQVSDLRFGSVRGDPQKLANLRSLYLKVPEIFELEAKPSIPAFLKGKDGHIVFDMSGLLTEENPTAENIQGYVHFLDFQNLPKENFDQFYRVLTFSVPHFLRVQKQTGKVFVEANSRDLIAHYREDTPDIGERLAALPLLRSVPVAALQKDPKEFTELINGVDFYLNTELKKILELQAEQFIKLSRHFVEFKVQGVDESLQLPFEAFNQEWKKVHKEHAAQEIILNQYLHYAIAVRHYARLGKITWHEPTKKLWADEQKTAQARFSYFRQILVDHKIAEVELDAWVVLLWELLNKKFTMDLENLTGTFKALSEPWPPFLEKSLDELYLATEEIINPVPQK